MNFWNLFVLRLHLGFADVPGGRETAGRLLERAHARNLIDFTELDPLALLMILAMTAPGSPAGAAAGAEVQRRHLHHNPYHLHGLVENRILYRRGVEDIVAIARHWREPPLNRLIVGILTDAAEHWLYRELCLFLGRTLWVDPNDPEVRAGAIELIGHAVTAHCARGGSTHDFPGFLYAFVLSLLHGRVIAVPPPYPVPNPPVWYRRIHPRERDFLTSCAGFSIWDVFLVYLHLYAGLTVGGIAVCFEEARSGEEWPPARVLGALEDLWTQVLDAMPVP